ncbi:MAG TPA: hypothetical protein VMS17_33790 [Gemmataceae bacterium]|nr:hypothetical protein [Gemmataceae bacterium]
MFHAKRVAGLIVLSFVGLAWAEPPADKPDPAPAPAKWTILFRSDNPSLWDKDAKNSKGEQIAISLQDAPDSFQYLRLRRMDTREALILPLTPDQLQNGTVGSADDTYWWNGTAKDEWKGRHLGIVQNPRHKFPAPNGMIAVMDEGWDGFAGSGFGHKVAANDVQYYCWKGKEIPKTVFEIAVSDGPLSPEEKRCLLVKP